MNPFALWSLKRDVRSSCESLRNLAREVINKRKKAMKNDDYIPDDILTNIIKFEGEKLTMHQIWTLRISAQVVV